MPSSAAGANPPAVMAGRGVSAVNAAAAAAAMSSDISRRNPQEDYELLQVRNQHFFYSILNSTLKFTNFLSCLDFFICTYLPNFELF